jgi:hypothetical protein
VTHLADGGKTSVDGCALYCFSITMWLFISGAGPSPCTPTAPKSSEATVRPDKPRVPPRLYLATAAPLVRHVRSRARRRG